MQKKELTLAAVALLFAGVVAWSLFFHSGPGDAGPVVFEEGDLESFVEEGTGEESAGTVERTEIPAAEGMAEPRVQVRIEGRVVAGPGVPLEGAAVHLELRQPGVREVQRVRQPVITGTDGRFAFTGPGYRRFAVVLQVRAEEYAPLMAERDFPRGSATLDLGDLAVSGGGGLSGLVSDLGGTGLEGATVEVQPVSGNALARASDREEVLGPVTTDAGGSYRFAHLMAGAYRVRASAPGTQSASSPTVQVEDGRELRLATLSLAAGVELVGLVLGTGDAPIPGASVRAAGGRAVTAEDGRFRIEHLPPGQMSVEIRANGYTSWSRGDVDPAEDLIARLEVGLEVTGAVFDALSGAPVERFAAAIRRTRSLEPTILGTPGDQLRRRIDSLRAQVSVNQTPQGRARDEAIARELEARVRGMDRVDSTPLRVPSDLGAVEERPGGRFAFDGLDEGFYVVDVLSPDHQFGRSDPVELRRGLPAPEMRLTVVPGLAVAGVVTGPDGAAVEGVLVELTSVRPQASDAAPAADIRFDWAVSGSPPRGDPVMASRSDAMGRFEFRGAGPGRYYVSARHPDHAAAWTPVFDLVGDRQDLEIPLAPAASLRGRITGIPPGRESEARVVALGGASTMRTAAASSDGSYVLESMEPGRYLVRAFLGDSEDDLADLLDALFAPGAEAVEPDIVLAQGEDRSLDVPLEVVLTGSVHGIVMINGLPAGGCRVELQSSDAATRMTAVPDETGQFSMNDVPVGDYQVRVTISSGGRQEFHRETVTVAAYGVAEIRANAACGGLRGRVVAADGTPAAQLDGTVAVLPGATQVPDDVGEYARSNRVHSLRVRDGEFSGDVVTAGPALVVVQIRGRQQVVRPIEIVPGAVQALELPAGTLR